MPEAIIIHSHFAPVLDALGTVDCIFADPPDGIGLAYGEYNDSVDEKMYELMLDAWMHCFVGKAVTTWISFNAKWTLAAGRICSYMNIDVKPCVQTFTFGQHNQHDFGNCHRPLWRLSQNGAPFYQDQVRVPSWRQLNGDKRADPRGRVPGDVFTFPRVTGNSKQRRKWCPTQLHEGLVERCILSCTKEGDWVFDPFAGSGTTLRVCRRINRNVVTCDVDREYCERIAEENGLKVSGIDALKGVL